MGKALRIVPALLVAAFVGFGASGHANQAAAKKETARAIFAGGCFWCMEPPFEKIDGVSSVVSGYTDGRTRNPTYEQVSAGVTGHTEAVEIVYDPAKVTYEKLLDVFWRNIDPLTRTRSSATTAPSTARESTTSTKPRRNWPRNPSA
jgi:hypothetical protein